MIISKNPKIGPNSSEQKLNDRIRIRISLHSCAGALACHHARRKERFGFHFDRIVSTLRNNFNVIYQLGQFFCKFLKLKLILLGLHAHWKDDRFFFFWFCILVGNGTLIVWLVVLLPSASYLKYTMWSPIVVKLSPDIIYPRAYVSEITERHFILY